MRNRNRHKRGGRPPFVDPLFAEALSEHRRGKPPRADRKQDYKALMLCRQVMRALSLSLGELSVVDVTPSPDCTRLLVHVAIPGHIAVEQAMADLSIATPSLRAQVARAITRKRAPELAFIPASIGEVPDES